MAKKKSVKASGATKKKATTTIATRAGATAALAAAIPPIVGLYDYQCLYLRRVDLFVKDAALRALKVKYLIQEQYNAVVMYGIDGVISATSYHAPLRAFIRELRAAGVKRIILAYSNKAVKEFLNIFQDSSVPAENFDKVISEIEPWVSTSGVTWPVYIDHLSVIRTWATAEPDSVDTMTYQGWIQKPTGTNAADNANKTIRESAKICLHHYNYPLPNPTYGLDRYKTYGAELLKLGYTATRRKTFLPIYSAEIDFSQEGFKTKSPLDCYKAHLAAFKAMANFPGKECIDLSRGFIVFKDTDLMISRPPRF